MILYLAGLVQDVRKQKYRKEFEHALFSKAAYSKRNFRIMKKRKLRELKEERHGD